MALHLGTKHYDAVYWLDADFVIWDVVAFTLPMPRPGAVVLPREVYYHTDGSIELQFNNSVLGFCRWQDANELAMLTSEALDAWAGPGFPPHTIAGPRVVSRSRLPLERIVANKAACFSEFTIKKILGPRELMWKHLRTISLLHGETVCGANLCSSRNLDNEAMIDVLSRLHRNHGHQIGEWGRFSSICRALLKLRNFPFRVRCWLQTRFERVRGSLTKS